MEMKKRIKKIGVLAVLLANVAIFAPKEAEGQRTIVIDEMGTDKPEYKMTQATFIIFGGSVTVVRCGGDGVGCIQTITVNG
jgi:hypothetical protein